jgi:DNA-binding NtrC family response regulator
MNEPSNNSKMTSSVRAIIGAEVLIIDKDESVREGVASLAGQAKMHATGFGDPADAWAALRERFFSVVVVDLDTPDPNAGLETVTSVRMISPTSSIIVLTPRKSYEGAVEVVRAGALDVVHKSPVSVDYLRARLIYAAGLSQQKRTLDATLAEASATHENFLQLLMKAEREVTDLKDKVAQRDLSVVGEELRILVVDRNNEFAKELQELAPRGYSVEHAQSGGEALDRGSNTKFHFGLVSPDLPDLPQSMVMRSLKGQNEEMVALTFRGPGEGGSLEIADGGAGVTVIGEFGKTQQLVDRLPDLAEAFHAKERQRRYTQAFREKHYDFVRKFVSLKEKLDAATT